MENTLKRLLSFAVALVMVLGMVPFNGLQVYATTASGVTTEAELKEALTAGGNVTLGGDIDVATQIEIPAGTLTLGYTKEVDSYVRVWGEANSCNAAESFVIKLYSGETLMATTVLNNIDNIIDGDIPEITWNFFYPESNDEYWTTTWEEGHPNSAAQPDKIVLYVDGTEVSTNEVRMHAPDNLAPVVWKDLGGVKLIVTSLSGTGTEADPFLIGNVEELLWFQAKVDEQAADGSTQFAGKYFKLTADINLAGINWNPIGSMSGDHGSFKGVFDGDGHTISNLNCQQAGNGLGLFARTAGNAQIKNLTLNNVTVKSTDNSNYVGAVVGNSYASTKITNVHVTGAIDISGRGYIGGISGHGYVVMDNVSVVGKGTIYSTFWCAGGILGYAGEGATNIMNAKVEGTGSNRLTITSAAGGLGAIVGMAEDNNGTQPISGSNLSAKNVNIKTYTGAYGDAYANYALGYLYGGNPTSKLTDTLTVENVSIETSNGETPEVVDAVATVDGTVFFNLQSAVNAAAGKTVTVLRDVTEEIQIVNGTEAVVDLNGKTLNGCFKPFEGKLTLKNGSIVNSNASYSAIEINAGELVLTDVDVTSTRHAVRIDGAVTATINGGNYGVNATSGTRHAVNVSGAANVTIKAGTFVGPKGTTMDSGAAVNVQTGATVTIEGGNFSKGKNNTLGVSGTLIVKGGIFDQNPAAYVAEGYVYTVKADGTFGVYETLQEAVNASVAGDTVVLTGNVELTESLSVAPMANTYALNAEQGITLDLNGKTITSDISTIVVDGGELTVKDSGTTGKIITTDATGDYEAIAVKNGGKLTLAGGTVESGKYGIYAYTSVGTVVMTGGTVKAHYMAIAMGGGSAAISGGTLICDSYIVYDWNKDLITITGGTFSKRPNAAYIAYGYGTKEVTVDSATYYQVTIIDPVAYIGEVGYYTIDAAIKAAQDGDTIIVNTCTVNGDVSVNKDITLQAAEGATVTINGDLNITADGATVKGLTVVSGGTALYINAKDVLVEACDITGAWSGMYQSYTTGKVTFKDSKITGKGAYAIHFDGSAGGEIVIDNCELSGWTSLAASIKNVTVTDTKFVENDANNYVRFYQENVVIDGCTFNEKMNVDLAVDNATVTVTDSTVENGNVEDLFGDADIVNSTITVDGVKLARAAKIGDTYYKTIADAIAAANEGDTVTLLADCTAKDVYVRMGRTLDLNGYKLTVSEDAAAPNATAHIIDSTNGKGVLAIAQDDISFNDVNKYLPVWVEGEGFHFVTHTIATAYRTHATHPNDVADGAIQFRFRVNGAADCLLANEWLDGGADNGVSVKVKMTWTKADGRASCEQYFTFTEKYLKEYAQYKAEDNNFSTHIFTLTINGAADVADVAFTAMVVYDNVAIASDVCVVQ